MNPLLFAGITVVAAGLVLLYYSFKTTYFGEDAPMGFVLFALGGLISVAGFTLITKVFS